MKPLVKWGGGKSREIKYFDKYIPSFDKYIEPFVGGGALYFYINHNDNVINDIHPELINLYQQIANDNGKKIYELMSKYDNTEDDYYYIRDKFKPSNDIERAFVFFYLRKTCYRGMLRYNKKGHFNVPFGRYKTYNYEILLDKQYNRILRNTIILNTDVSEVFDMFNDTDNFVFLDPPYDSVFSNYGFCNYDKDKHIELYNKFITTNNKCLMVIGETDFIKQLYNDYIIDVFKKKYAFKIHSGRISDNINNNHLIICNYKINIFF
jgi:DNA adenine methylase